MVNKWFYSHNGQTEGPFTTLELKERVAQGKIGEEDPLWVEGTDSRGSIPAGAALDFSSRQPALPPPSRPASPARPASAVPPGPLSTPSAPAGTVPDWLSDVQSLETKGPQPEPVAPSETPDWLEDLRLWVGLELYTPSPPPPIAAEGSPAGPPAPSPGIPDWLEGWALEEKPKKTSPEEIVNKVIESWLVEDELAPPSPPKPAQPEKLRTAPAATDVPMASPVPPPAHPKTVLEKPPFPPPAAKVPPSRAADELVDKTIQEMGFDPRTGRILDPEKFRQWKQAERAAAAQPGQTNASVMEVFHKARSVLGNWVDDDQNRLRILHGDLAEIKSTPTVQAILAQYAKYGKEMMEKLTRHLEFLIENRRKYYRAMGKPGARH